MLESIEMVEIPQIGLGTWTLKGDHAQKTVETALEIGYRHIDAADRYGNHQEIGIAIKNSKVQRNEIFLVTKIYPSLTKENILKAGPRFLEELNTDYIDLLLVHWPDYNPIPQVLETFQKLQEQGITRHIGVSNFSLAQVKEAIGTGIKIYNHQFEIYSGHINEELITFCQENDIKVTAYSPLNKGKVAHDKKIQELAQKHNATPTQVALKQLIDMGLIVIPKASSYEHLKENFESTKISLTD